MMKPYLETERMLLRQFEMDDVENLVDLDSNPSVTKYINGGLPTPREHIIEKVMPRIFSYYERLDRQGIWAVNDKSTGLFMGWFHLRPNHADPSETELGYRFKQKYWGQGLATEGSKALLKKGFEELKVIVIVAIADPDNTASIRVMEKVGMRYFGEYKEADGFVVVKYGLLSKDYFTVTK